MLSNGLDEAGEVAKSPQSGAPVVAPAGALGGGPILAPAAGGGAKMPVPVLCLRGASPIVVDDDEPGF